MYEARRENPVGRGEQFSARDIQEVAELLLALVREGKKSPEEARKELILAFNDALLENSEENF